MPAKSEKQRRFMGAELARKRAGEETRTDMSEDKLGEFASKEFTIKDTLAFLNEYIDKMPKFELVPIEEAKEKVKRATPNLTREYGKKVVALHKKNPIWSASQIGEAIGISRTQVGAAFKREGFPFKRERDKALSDSAGMGEEGFEGKEELARSFQRGIDAREQEIEEARTHGQGSIPREILAQEGIREVVTPANLDTEQETLYRRRRREEAASRRSPRRLWTTERKPYSRYGRRSPSMVSEENLERQAVTNFEGVAEYDYAPTPLNEAQKRELQETAEANIALSSEFTSKQKLDWRGAWVKDPVSSENAQLNRTIATESRGIARAAQREKAKRHATKYRKNPFQKEEVADMNHEDFISKLDGHINHLEKRQRKGMSDTEAREFFDRDAAKVMSGRQRKRDAELRRERGLPEPPVTHVDRSVKFRDLEKQNDNDTSQEATFQAAIASNKAEANARRAEENVDTARRAAYSRRNRVQDAELFGTEDEYQTALASVTDKDKELMESGYPSKVRNINQPGVVKSKILPSKYLLPAQDSNGNMIPNDTIPFTQETNQLMSLAAAAIEKYVTKQYDDDESSTRAVRRNKKKASKRKMKVTGAGNKDSLRMIGKRAAEARGE